MRRAKLAEPVAQPAPRVVAMKAARIRQQLTREAATFMRRRGATPIMAGSRGSNDRPNRCLHPSSALQQRPCTGGVHRSPFGSRRRARTSREPWLKHGFAVSPVASPTSRPPVCGYPPDPVSRIRARSQPMANPSGESGVIPSGAPRVCLTPKAIRAVSPSREAVRLRVVKDPGMRISLLLGNREISEPVLGADPRTAPGRPKGRSR